MSQYIVNDAAEIKIRAEYKAGQLLKEMQERGERDKGKGGDRKSQSHDVTVKPTLAALGVSKNESSRWQIMASIPEELYDNRMAQVRADGGEITTNDFFRFAKSGGKLPHVSHNSGENEWYTPIKYIEAARLVMGEIDLDPASTPEANKTVCAKVFYTEEEDGLRQNWYGRVWLNPPYASALVGRFTSKLTEHFLRGDVSDAIVLVNNSTDAAWFQEIAGAASAVVFPKGRIKFISRGGDVGSPLQGQAILFLGKEHARKFLSVFGSFGLGLRQ